MYRVNCDGYTLHDPALNDVRFQLLSPVVTQETNKAGSLTFVLPSMHTNANAIHRLVSVIEAYDDNKLIFRGRPLNDQEDWDRSRTVVCEGDLAMLNDSVLRPYTFAGTVEAYLRQLISWHNAQVPASKQFTVGTVTVVSNENPQHTITRESATYPKTWNELEEKLLNMYSGYLFVTWTGTTNRIDYLADSPYHCTQSVELAKNLLDVSKVNKGEDIITGLIPLGAKDEETGERLTIKSVNGGLDYITNTAAVNAYGLILDSEIFDTITNASELLVRGQERLAERAAGMTTITLTAADLHLIDAEISSFDFMSYVTVNDPDHDITGEMLVTKKTTNLEDPAQGKMTIGRESTGISQYYAGTVSEISRLPETYATKSEVTTVQTTIQSEIDQQDNKISMVVAESAGSYVIRAAEIVQSINETGSSIKISADHIALTGEVVVSLINGGSTTINGSKITTGTLNTSAIGAGTIDASVINVTNINASNIKTGLISDDGGNNYWNLDSGEMRMTTGSIVSTYTETIDHSDYSQEDLDILDELSSPTSDPLTPEQKLKYDIDGTGLIDDNDYARIEWMITTGQDITRTITTTIDPKASDKAMRITTSVPATGSTPANSIEAYYSGAKTQSATIYCDRIVFSGDTHATMIASEYDEEISIGQPSIRPWGHPDDDVQVQNDKWQTVNDVDLPPGMWFITAVARFTQSATGRRMVCISTDSDTMTDGHPGTPVEPGLIASVAACSGARTSAMCCGPIYLSETTHLYMNCYQNSGGTKGTLVSLRITRVV